MKRAKLDPLFMCELLRPINFDGEWGRWECPACGEENDDPDDICVTTCSCGATVLLSEVDEGYRHAWIQD